MKVIMDRYFNAQDIAALARNPIFLSAIFSWIISQAIKTIIKLITGKIRSHHEFIEFLIWRTGGMPSSHSALVASLVTSMGIHVGINSEIFILSVFFALVTIRDALGVRRSSGMQAKTINDLGESLSKQLDVRFKPVKEVLGHTPVEVFSGMFLGLIISILFTLLAA